MIASTLVGEERMTVGKVKDWINGITAGGTVEAEPRQASKSTLASPFEFVPRPITDAEMARFAKMLNGFVFVFGQYTTQFPWYPAPLSSFIN